MLNQWLSVLFQASVGPVFGLAMESMQKIRKNRVKKWMRLVFWIVLMAGLAVNKVFTNGSEAGSIAFAVIFLAALVISAKLFYDGKFWHRILVGILLLAAMMFAECGTALVCWVYQAAPFSMDYRQSDMMVGCLIGNIFSNAAMFLVAAVWRHFGLQKRMPRGSLVFVLMALCLLIPNIHFYFELTAQNGAFSPILLVSMGSAFILCLLLVCVQFNQAEKDDLERELLGLKHQSALERQHYENVEARREEIAKIRHDYNNILNAILGLLHTCKVEEAEELVSGLLSRVELTKEYPYCGIPVVNVVLSEKEQECRRLEIRFCADLLFPENVAVDPIDLCRVFSNLLDNAIHATARFPGEQKVIVLHVGIQGDYLIIRCDNPAQDASEEPPARKGYGMKILKDIAQRYEGSVQTEFTDGRFIARVVLLTTPGVNFAENSSDFACVR